MKTALPGIHRRISRISSHHVEAVDHRESVPGQRTPTLCSWEGGSYDPTPDPAQSAVPCHDCESIVKWALSLHDKASKK